VHDPKHTCVILNAFSVAHIVWAKPGATVIEVRGYNKGHSFLADDSLISGIPRWQ
jgi:hypothetical protein